MQWSVVLQISNLSLSNSFDHVLQLAGTGVKLSIGYPLDTDTPGFANENLTKVGLVCFP